MYRNLMSMCVEEMILAQPMDSVILMGGCDKTVPALLMGAFSANIPSCLLVSGPMMTGRHKGERLGACTDCRRFWAKYRSNEIDKNEINTSEFSIDDLIIWDVEDGMVKVGSARLIELIQNRLPKSNNVTIYSNHSLVLTTNAKASQGDVISYANEIMKTVKDVFNIKLEIEPIVIN